MKFPNTKQKKLMDKFTPMKCGNKEEFNQRLQWLSEGMLCCHLYNTGDYKSKVEIELYSEYKKFVDNN